MALLQPFEVDDFSKGITDFYLSGPVNAGYKMDNLLINKNKKIFTRFGSQIRSTTDEQIPDGVQRIGRIWFHNDQLFEVSKDKVLYFTSSYNTLTGPTSNAALPSNAVTNYVSHAFWNNHTFLVSDNFCTPQKIYKTGSTYYIRSAGLPALASSPTVTAGAAGANNYIYAFLYYYTYVVEGVTFEDYGATTLVSLANAAAPDSNTVAITGIPVITNGTSDNYDTTVIKVKIYRTENNLTTLKYIGEVTNGTTTYNDSASDSSITNNTLIYTTGDVVDNDPPPPAKFIHIAKDIAAYGYVKESGVEIPNKVRFSIQGDPDSCPEAFFLEFPQDIMGISSYQGTFLIFCESSIYRCEGGFDEQGNGGFQTLKISDTVGTVSNDSIVQTDMGIFFCARQGFYYCNGYSVKKISDNLDVTYPPLIAVTSQGKNIVGAYDKIENRVWWTTQRETASTDNDSCFVLDLNFPLEPNATFTTVSNGSYFKPTFIVFKDTYMYRADTRGYILIHNEDYKTDAAIDQTVLAANWATAPIIHDYISCAFDFGSPFVRKWVSKILCTFANDSNLSVQVYSINDDGKSTLQLSPITYDGNIVWGDPNVLWGDPNIEWNQRGLIEEKRFFPATGLRCNYKQVRITNAYHTVLKSDNICTATISASALTVTLTNASYSWPSDIVGYYLSFSTTYTAQFQVISRDSATQVTVSDPLGQIPASGTYSWLLKGYRKNEVMHVLSYVIHFKPMTDTQKSYHNPPDGGVNA